MNFDMGIPRS